MDIGADSITEEEFDGWYPPSVVVRQLEAAWSSETARYAIVGRLKLSDMRAAARITSPWIGDQEGLRESFWLVLPRLWAKSDAANDHNKLWSAGDITFRTNPGGPYSPKEEVACIDVRFEPAGVDRILAAAGAPSLYKLAAIRAQVAAQPEPVQPPLSSPSEEAVCAASQPSSPQYPVGPATLTAWWAICRTIKGADSWTVPEMEAFLERCFPGHSVSRERVRKLRGAVRPGPKGRPAE
jgi:hypothetical protein